MGISPAYATVAAAVADADPGDTIELNEGTVDWGNNELLVEKGLTIIGAGQESTIINGSPSTRMIRYDPTDYSANRPFRLSGFKLDGGGNGQGLYLDYSTSNLTIQTRIRIDNILFNHFGTQALTVCGMRGVCHDCTFTNTGYPIRFPSGDDADWWDNWEGLVFGKVDNNFYVEDCLIYADDIVADAQFANRYAFRYNDIDASEGDNYPLFDLHGDKYVGESCSYRAAFGCEMYGNDIAMGAGYMMDARGGRILIFCNSTTGTNVGVKLREEYCEPGPSDPCYSTNSQPQHISDTYVFNNRKNYNGVIFNAYDGGIADCGDDTPTENSEWFNHNAAFDGTSGIGVGTLAARPATCTVGVGYWATDQDLSNLTNFVGRDPTTPLSGTFYRCTSTNVWTEYFTPLAYPHPLRGSAGASKLVMALR